VPSTAAQYAAQYGAQQQQPQQPPQGQQPPGTYGRYRTSRAAPLRRHRPYIPSQDTHMLWRPCLLSSCCATG
jgi:hypothetical protein